MLKNWANYGDTYDGAGGWSPGERSPFIYSNIVNRIIIKLSDNCWGHIISAKFDNQLDRMKQIRIMSLQK